MHMGGAYTRDRNLRRRARKIVRIVMSSDLAGLASSLQAERRSCLSLGTGMNATEWLRVGERPVCARRHSEIKRFWASAEAYGNRA